MSHTNPGKFSVWWFYTKSKFVALNKGFFHKRCSEKFGILTLSLTFLWFCPVKVRSCLKFRTPYLAFHVDILYGPSLMNEVLIKKIILSWNFNWYKIAWNLQTVIILLILLEKAPVMSSLGVLWNECFLK